MSRGIEIAHLKMTLTPDEGTDLAVLNLVRTEVEPELVWRLQEPLTSGELIVNLRAEGDPEVLREVVGSALDAIANNHNWPATASTWKRSGQANQRRRIDWRPCERFVIDCVPRARSASKEENTGKASGTRARKQ